MTIFPQSHCHSCGTRYEMTSWPRKCKTEGCGNLQFHNLTAIGVLLQTVTDGTRTGILTPVRGIQPQRGMPGLVGGFNEASDDGCDHTAMREYIEEIHREAPNRENLRFLLSRGSGPLHPPGRRQELTFFLNPDPIHVDEFAGWVPDEETLAIEFSWKPRLLAFPLHTLALATYFRRHQGVDAPDYYFDQPRTGDTIVGAGEAEVVHNVPYAQPDLDGPGLWTVEGISAHDAAGLSSRGPTPVPSRMVRVRHDHGDWIIVD